MVETENLIRTALDTQAEGPESIAALLNECSTLLGSTAELVAKRKAQLEVAEAVALHKLLQEHGKKFPPTLLNKLLASQTAKELEQYTYADRLRAGLAHKIDSLRSLLSYEKEQLTNAKFQPQ